MSRKQVENCAARLPAEERAQFERMLAEAGTLIGRGVRLRRRAWRLYRNHVLEQAGELAAAGLGEAEIAARLGISRPALLRLLARAARERHG